MVTVYSFLSMHMQIINIFDHIDLLEWKYLWISWGLERIFYVTNNNNLVIKFKVDSD